MTDEPEVVIASDFVMDDSGMNCPTHGRNVPIMTLSIYGNRPNNSVNRVCFACYVDFIRRNCFYEVQEGTEWKPVYSAIERAILDG